MTAPSAFARETTALPASSRLETAPVPASAAPEPIDKAPDVRVSVPFTVDTPSATARALLATSVPANTETGPVAVRAAASVNVPAPFFVKLPAWPV